MEIGKEIEKHYTAALNELAVPDIDYTRKVLDEIGIEQSDGTYACDRVAEQDFSYLFYFRIRNSHYYYRILVMKEDASVYSAKIVSGNGGRIRIKNDHRSRTHDEWRYCFAENTRAEVIDTVLYMNLTEHTAYGINEIVDLFTKSVREDKRKTLGDYSLENDCVLEIETFMPRAYEEEAEIEKWSIMDLARYRLGMEIKTHIE